MYVNNSEQTTRVRTWRRFFRHYIFKSNSWVKLIHYHELYCFGDFNCAVFFSNAGWNLKRKRCIRRKWRNVWKSGKEILAWLKLFKSYLKWLANRDRHPRYILRIWNIHHIRIHSVNVGCQNAFYWKRKSTYPQIYYGILCHVCTKKAIWSTKKPIWFFCAFALRRSHFLIHK